uniref:Uncharacterized protein n=1 Tax=Triticum urartu TaxID=4572 RepID=A0A8R7QEP2_TRIUA
MFRQRLQTATATTDAMAASLLRLAFALLILLFVTTGSAAAAPEGDECCTAATAGPASTRSQPPSFPSRALLHLAGGAEHRPPVLAHYAQLLLHL